MSSSGREINAVILGATGYVGGEVLRLVSSHPHFTLSAAVSESRADEAIGAVFPHLSGACAGKRFAKPGEWIDALDRGSELALFSAAPHGASASIVADALELAGQRNLAVHVVDCSADFRYPDAAQYERVYKSAHAAPALLGQFSCGVPEHVGAIDSEHVGHPGCFSTAILLAIVPLAGLSTGPMFVSAVTGSTGSGRSAQPGTHHPERHSNLYAYKPLAHRHAPEIERLAELATGTAVSVQFVPHSGPFSRGIYATVQAQLRGDVPADTVPQAFHEYYADAEFVHIVDGTPRLKDVVGSNDCHIGIAAANGTVVVTAAIDNLVKGAAGGAVQWMNRLWSLPETSGLLAPATPWI
ncbi:MAG TPA: N-acetyl-gamma-glutamyl-phosphate reductase [Woeseiaceae bacterium]|nr:N-acetyl-gamma-glutamyl-phosphate reductase [Woeseiaceae bacterium]